MSEKTKEKKEIAEDEVEKETGEWSKDQRERGYYYDDNHGYEIYNADEDDEEDEE